MPQPRITAIYPLATFALLCAGVIFFLESFHRLSLLRFPDSIDYEALASSRISGFLGQFRTPGYLLFLRVMRHFSPSLKALPYCQALLHSLSVLIFATGLRSIGLGKVVAGLVAGPLLCSPLMWTYGGSVLTEVVGESLAIATLGFFFYSFRHATKIRWEVAVAFCAFCSYIVRPFYVFLVLLVPVLAWVGGDRRSRYWFLMGLPLVAYCSLRWIVVRDFSLVPFSSITLVGYVGADLVERDVVDRIAPIPARIAREALLKRDSDPKWTEIKNRGDSTVDGDLYDYTASKIYLPLTEKILEKLPSVEKRQTIAIRMNDVLGTLCWSVIRLKPVAYAKHVAENFAYGSWRMLQINPLFLLLSLGASMVYLFSSANEENDRRQFRMVGALCLLFPLMSMVMVCVIQTPIDRFLGAAGVFLPLAPALLIADRLE